MRWITYRSTGDADAMTMATLTSPRRPARPTRCHVAAMEPAAGQHRDVEAADVHAELQGVGGHDAQHLAVAKATLDGPSLRGQVAGAVAADPRAGSEISAKRLPSVDSMISTAVRVRPKITVCRPARRNGSAHPRERQRRATRAGGRIQHRRVHEQEVAAPTARRCDPRGEPAVR